MRRSRAFARGAVVLAGVVLVVMCTSAGTATTSSGSTQQLAVPAYFSPSGDPGTGYWQRLGDGAVGLVVANPANGPGAAYDKDLAHAIRKATDDGIQVLGYVDTGYFGVMGSPTRGGQTTTDAWNTQIRSDMDAWYRWYGDYGLAGVFFDRALSDCGTDDAHVNFYGDLNWYAKHHYEALTVDNPGQAPDECYSWAADVLVTFEGTYADYQNWTVPDWELCPYYPVRFWHLVFSAPSQDDMAAAMSLSHDRNAAYVYVTPDGLPDPWDSLPDDAYWSKERYVAASAPINCDRHRHGSGCCHQ